MKVAFPSIEFFQALQTLMRAEREHFKRLGYFDTTFGVRVLNGGGRKHEYVLGFEVFDCIEVRAAADLAVEHLDFVLEAGLDTWVEMFRNIVRHRGADVAYGINTLTHFGERMRVVYDDPDGHDKLYRFAESIQEFMDLAAKLDIQFSAEPSAAPASVS